jgi:phage major head subunit gpT-like protein
MAVVTTDTLQAMQQAFEPLFDRQLSSYRLLRDYRRFARVVDASGLAQVVYNSWGTPPQMSNVTHGGYPRSGLARYAFTVANEDWQSAIEIEDKVLERRGGADLQDAVNELANRANIHPIVLILDSLIRANALAYDGTAFFADTRAIGSSGNIDNLLAGTGVTVAAFQTDLGVAQGALGSFKDDQGEPLLRSGNLIVIPPALLMVAYQALNVTAGQLRDPVLGPTDGGIYAWGGYDVMIDPYLTDANDWYLFSIGPGIGRPFILQEEVAPRFNISPLDTNDPFFREQHRVLFIAYGRYNVAFTDPRLGVKTVNT